MQQQQQQPLQFKPPPVPFANEVVCPLNPVPPGWDSLPVEQQPLVEWTIRYFAKIPDFLECAQVLRHSDKSISVCIFPYQNYEVELDLLRGATMDSHLGPHILHIECNMRSKSVMKPSIVGAIIVYLRTAEYNNAHPGSISRRALPPPVTAASARTIVLSTETASAFRHKVPDATDAERREINAIGNALITLQGSVFQASAQVFLRIDAQTYELRTFGYRYPITEDHLALISSIAGVQRVYVNFHLKRNEATGALIVVCRLAPRKRNHTQDPQVTAASAAAIGSLLDPGYQQDNDDDDEEDEDDERSAHHRTKRVAFLFSSPPPSSKTKLPVATVVIQKPGSSIAMPVPNSSSSSALDPLDELLCISTTPGGPLDETTTSSSSSASGGGGTDNKNKDNGQSLWGRLTAKIFGS